MCLRILPKLFAIGLSVLVLAACGGGGGSSSPSTPPETVDTISVFGSDGPMANADVNVFALYDYINPLIDVKENLLALGTATTDPTEVAVDIPVTSTGVLTSIVSSPRLAVI